MTHMRLKVTYPSTAVGGFAGDNASYDLPDGWETMPPEQQRREKVLLERSLTQYMRRHYRKRYFGPRLTEVIPSDER